MGNGKPGHGPDYPVVVASFGSDHRYRLVRIRGVGWEPLGPEEFEPRIREVFPDIDFNDPDQVHWVDHPEEWPAGHSGEP